MLVRLQFECPAMAKTPARAVEPVAGFQDPHELVGRGSQNLEACIGAAVRALRNVSGLTASELSRRSAISPAMLSKIENGTTSPSLATLQALAKALDVPVTELFRGFEETREPTYVRSSQGLTIERRGTRAGHQYQLLGHTIGRDISVEPYLITLTSESDVFPVFQHEGQEFIYMIEGKVGYRYAGKVYPLQPGDSLFFDAEAPHGPQELTQLPARFISVIVYRRRG
jgi:transcriptional regulator with XRE-family HTH domain